MSEYAEWAINKVLEGLSIKYGYSIVLNNEIKDEIEKLEI